MNIRYEKKFSAKLLRSHPRDIFVFGDNLERKGKGGQAVIRDEPNAFGVPTKREPRRAAEAYFSDQEDEMEAMVQSLRELYRKGKTATLVFPTDGLGTGLADMEKRSPKIFKKMNDILEEHFGVVFQPKDTAAPDNEPE